MAATVAVLGTSVFNTTAGNKTITATPTVGDLIIIITAATGVATTIADNGTGGTYTQVDSTRTGFSTTGNLQMWVRDNIIASAVSTTYTATQTSSTGGGLVILRVTGMSVAGSAAIRSSGGQSSGTAATTPAPVLSSTPLSTNPVIMAVANGTNSTTTLTPRTGYTEDFDNGYSTPATGLEVSHRASGETSATLTAGSTTATAFASIAVELQYNTAPTTALTLPLDTYKEPSTTPQLVFAGTDADSDAVTYEVQVDTVNTFNSVASGAVTTYYFDGSDAAATDPNGVWTNDANAFDGSTATAATSNADGSQVSNFLKAEGTNAPSSGGTITQVRARHYDSNTSGGAGFSRQAYVYTDSLGQLLGNTSRDTASAAGFSSYVILSTPTGGWDWTKLGALEVKIVGGGAGVQTLSVYKVELEVTSVDTPLIDKLSNTDPGFVDITNGSDPDPFNSGDQIGFYPNATATTYYFDGHVSTTNNGTAWTNPANAFDGSTSTSAGRSGSASLATSYLEGVGTNAPSSGGTIVMVQARLWGVDLDTAVRANIFTNVRAESLGVATGAASYGSYVTLATPAAGWDWSTLQNLDVVFTRATGVSSATVFRTEILVTTATGLTNGTTYYWRARSKDTAGTNTYGAWATTRSFQVDTTAPSVSTDISTGFSGTVTRTWYHTVYGPNPLLILTADLWQDVAGTGTVTAVSFNSVALTQIGTGITNGAMRSEMWYLKAPPTGTYLMSVTVTNATDARKFSAASFSGYDQTSPLDASNTATASTGNPSASVTTLTANALVVATLSRFSTTAATTNRTSIFNDAVTSVLGAASYQLATTTGSYSDTYTGSAAQDWSMTIASFKPFSSGTSVSITQVAATVTATGGTQTVAATSSAAVTQVAATVTATGGTQTIATVNKVAIAQVAATVTATGGTQTIATVNNVAITQVAATVTATGGAQTVVGIVFASASITQVAATVTATGGTQVVSAVIVASAAITQVAATVTATGGTQSVATVNNVSITQVAASVTATGGTQAVATSQFSAITQAAATVTATGGTQALSGASTVAQVAATVTATGGTQTVATVNIVGITQVAAAVTATGGTQTVATVRNASATQVAGTVTATGGSQTLATVNNVAITQTAGTVTATGGVQSLGSVVSASITQVAATVTATGGTQAVATTQLGTVTQVGATVTATGGTQVILSNATITQAAATVTATGGTQVVATVQNVSISQVAASVTATGGAQAIATVNNSSVTQVAATVTATGGTQIIASANFATVTQVAATVTVTGGTQSLTAMVDAAIAQQAATVTATGGTQSLFAGSGAASASVTQVGATVTATGGVPVITTSTGPLPRTGSPPIITLLDGRTALKVGRGVYLPL